MIHSNVVNKFHDNDCLSDTGTTKKTNLTTLGIRSKKIDNFDTSYKNFLRFTLFSEQRSRSVNGSLLVTLDRTLLINRLSNNIKNTTKSTRSYGNHDWGTCICNLLTSNKTFSG